MIMAQNLLYCHDTLDEINSTLHIARLRYITFPRQPPAWLPHSQTQPCLPKQPARPRPPDQRPAQLYRQRRPQYLPMSVASSHWQGVNYAPVVLKGGDLRKVEVRNNKEERCACHEDIIVVFVNIRKGTWPCFGDWK